MHCSSNCNSIVFSLGVFHAKQPGNRCGFALFTVLHVHICMKNVHSFRLKTRSIDRLNERKKKQTANNYCGIYLLSMQIQHWMSLNDCAHCSAGSVEIKLAQNPCIFRNSSRFVRKPFNCQVIRKQTIEHESIYKAIEPHLITLERAFVLV